MVFRVVVLLCSSVKCLFFIIFSAATPSKIKIKFNQIVSPHFIVIKIGLYRSLRKQKLPSYCTFESNLQVGCVGHTCNLSTGLVEEEGFEVKGLPGLYDPPTHTHFFFFNALALPVPKF